jgi:hypothetical protein
MVYTTVRIHIRPGGVSHVGSVFQGCVLCGVHPCTCGFVGASEQGLFLLCLACGINPLQLNIVFLRRTSLVGWQSLCCAPTFHFDYDLDPHRILVCGLWIRCQSGSESFIFKNNKYKQNCQIRPINGKCTKFFSNLKFYHFRLRFKIIFLHRYSAIFLLHLLHSYIYFFHLVSP